MVFPSLIDRGVVEIISWLKKQKINRFNKRMIMHDPFLFQCVEESNKTKELCLIAVSRSADNLKYIHDQDEQICIASVKKNGLCLKYVKKKTYNICLEAVTENGLALEFVDLEFQDSKLIKKASESILQMNLAKLEKFIK